METVNTHTCVHLGVSDAKMHQCVAKLTAIQRGANSVTSGCGGVLQWPSFAWVYMTFLLTPNLSCDISVATGEIATHITNIFTWRGTESAWVTRAKPTEVSDKDCFTPMLHHLNKQPPSSWTIHNTYLRAPSPAWASWARYPPARWGLWSQWLSLR